MTRQARHLSARIGLAVMLLQGAIFLAGGVILAAVLDEDAQVGVLFLYALAGLLCALTTWIVLVVGLRQTLMRRLGRTADTLHEIERGELSRRIPITDHDEIGVIQDGINRVVDALAERTQAAAEGTQRLQRSEANLASILAAVADGVAVLDAEGRVLRLNPAAEDMLDTSEREAIGLPLTQFARLLDADRRQSVALPAPEHLSDAALHPQPHLVLDNRRGERPISLRATPLRIDGEIRGSVLVLSDISDLLELQERVHQSQKLEAVGQLAGGVAHDFNNLLTVITGQAEMVTSEADLDARHRDRLELVLRAAGRAADLTSSLLAFARKGQLPSRWFELHEAVTDTVSLVGDTLDERIVLSTELGADRDRIKGQRTQLQNVIMNLCLNARDAMPDGGSITITTRTVRLESDRYRGRPHGLAIGPFIELSVADTGHGIAPEIRDRIFEPFFTTKEPGEGTGLGLASAYGTLADHGGTITVESTPGKGSTFYLLIPLRDETTGALSASDSAVVQAPEGTILVADDDPSVRLVLVTMLERMGHTVIEAIGGREAVATYTERRDEIDLVMIDLMMPVLDGYAALQQLFALDPDLVAITCSGYADLGRDIDTQLKRQINAHLTKPYRYGELEKAVNKALAKAAED